MSSAAGELPQRVTDTQLGAYRDWLATHWPEWRATKVAVDSVRLLDAYAALLPVCTLARCPFCGAAVAEPFDTFSLNGLGWREPPTGYGWLHRSTVRPLAPDCTHLRIVAWYLNLEGRTPDDLFPGKIVRTGPEVPSIMRVPMSADGALAVIRPLPVGRWDDATPAHRYTTWFVSYFTESREAFETATRSWGLHYGRVEFGDVDYDLAKYAREGRLRWMYGDADQLAPPDEPFPYAEIDGDRAPERILTRDGVEHPSEGVIGRVSRWLHRG